MPELFGSIYILPAIIVVALLLLLFLLLLVRNRRKASIATGQRVSADDGHARKKSTTASPTSPERVPSTQAGSKLAEDAYAGQPGVEISAPPMSQPVGLSQAPAVPAWQPPAMTDDDRTPGTIAVLRNPLRAVLLDILQGWGNITPEDTRRLEVFRPERIMAAIESLDLPKDLRNREYARSRLGQLRQHVSGLLHDQSSAQPGATTESGTQSPPTAESGEETGTELAAETPPASGETTESIDQDFAAVESPQATGLEQPAPTQVREAREVEVMAERATEGLNLGLGETGAAWAADEVGTTTPAEWQEEPLKAEETVVPEEPVLLEESAEMTELEAAPEPPVAEYAAEESIVLEEVAEVPEHEASSEQRGEPEQDLAGLGMRVRTAHDVLTLPPEERREVVAFLEPGELSNLFRATADPQLKKAIIDALENIHTPAALDVLRTCLDDPNPEIQVYALEAADRLLGTR